MKSFASTVAQIMKNLVAGPIGAQDMNAGEEFVDRPDKHYGRDEDADLYREDEELDKSVVPQHYIPEYGSVEVLFKSGPPAMVIKANDELRDDITDREIVVGGYSSPQVIDREKHLIQKEAMAKDLPRFLAEPLYANAMILHSNVQVGQVLSDWTNPKTGKTYKTQVDDIGLFCVIRIRTDQYRPKIVDKVVEDIEKGNLKAFSISGDAPLDSRQHKCADGECFWIIPSIEFYEITICEEGVNQGAKLMILSKSCIDGKCGLVTKEEPPALTPTPPMEPEPDIKETSGAATGSLGGEKATGTGNIGKDGGASPIPEGVDIDQPKPTPQAALPTGVLDMDAEETKETLTERVGEIADVVGEKEAVELVEDVVEASEKLDNVGAGIGSGGSGDANTMGDFGKPYSRDTAVMKGDPSIDLFVQTYRTFLARGASPEDAYFKLLEDGAGGEPAPPWFGTRDGKFRQFLTQVYHAGLAIPTIRLRMQGNKEGEIVPDPELMAWDLLQTAVNRMRGMIDKDVSPVAHPHCDEGYNDLVDERGLPHTDDREPTNRELNEPEESEEYYLNLALKTLNKADSTLGAIAGSKIHEAYTVAMDGIYRLGHLTQDQRIDLSSAITDALDAFHKEIGDMGDLEIPAADVALLMKAGDGAVEALSRKFHEVYQEEAKRQGDVRHTDRYEDLSEDIKEFDRVLARYVLSHLKKHCTSEFHLHPPDFEGPACKDGQGGLEKHKDKTGSTEHHQKGGAGAAAPQPYSAPQDDMQMEDRVQTLTAEIKDRNAKGANLRLSPGYRNAPYSVTGMDALQRPLRLVGNVADITQALRENSAEVDALVEQKRQVQNYAVPVDVGRVNELKIIEGDKGSPLQYIREQVARASFDAAVAIVLKQPKRGWQARDYRIDDRQQWEPENVGVMGGVRTPGNQNMQGHATTEIESQSDIERISGARSTGDGLPIATEPVEQVPEAHGIAQQGAVSPPRGVQGVGAPPEFVQDHEEIAGGMYAENEGTALDPRADADNRGAPVAHRTQRP